MAICSVIYVSHVTSDGDQMCVFFCVCFVLKRWETEFSKHVVVVLMPQILVNIVKFIVGARREPCRSDGTPITDSHQSFCSVA